MQALESVFHVCMAKLFFLSLSCILATLTLLLSTNPLFFTLCIVVCCILLINLMYPLPLSSSSLIWLSICNFSGSDGSNSKGGDQHDFDGSLFAWSASSFAVAWPLQALHCHGRSGKLREEKTVGCTRHGVLRTGIKLLLSVSFNISAARLI